MGILAKIKLKRQSKDDTIENLRKQLKLTEEINELNEKKISIVCECLGCTTDTLGKKATRLPKQLKLTEEINGINERIIDVLCSYIKENQDVLPDSEGILSKIHKIKPTSKSQI